MEVVMGKPLMLKEQDDERIEQLKKRLGARTKVDVVRSALDLLEKEAERSKRVKQWKRAVQRIGKTSKEVLKDFQPHSRLRRNG
ncbi:hypothetical protein UR09_04645 [Candidatus Nitromaritima sp. SCGC AAA799-A02]|nr:hypothetical protein UR09_04645 [Candidatus Nitromaritima sp. SCGC AAA799-A02]